MNENDYNMHFVSTHEEARQLAYAQSRFWISNCGCRESRGHCSRSRMDICLIFRGDIGSSGSGIREIALPEVLGIFEEAHLKHLITRPFRSDKDPALVDGICFCCDDCCGYLLSPDKNECDRGKLVESTIMDECTYCGDCVAVCHFQAREMRDDQLLVINENCFGCGLCAEICPEKAIQMVVRA